MKHFCFNFAIEFVCSRKGIKPLRQSTYIVFLSFSKQDSQRLQEENDETQSDEKVPSYKKLDKKVNAVVRNWTCQAKDADAERKFHAKVSLTIAKTKLIDSNYPNK